MNIRINRYAAFSALFLGALVQGASAAGPHAKSTSSLSAFLTSAERRTAAWPRAQFGRAPANDQDVALADRFDRDENGRLDAAERNEARLEAERLGLNRSRGRRGGGPASTIEVPPGPRVTPASVRPYPTTSFYDVSTLRTIFLDFENADWERELMAFKRTDIDVPAEMTVDGKRYRDVGIQFHGNSSFSSVPLGKKHSMRIAMDAVHGKQDIAGYNTLLLLNSHDDPTFLRTVLYMQIARQYGPAPQANFVHVVINGESWGIYVNQQHFNKDLVEEAFKTRDGARWKVPGSPGSRSGGLSYLGENHEVYKQAYEIKTKDAAEDWAALVQLARTLEQTPADRLESELAPLLEVDEVLNFLAVDNALVNWDGYWTRGSDYSLYRSPAGRFHVLPYDVNSSFALGGVRGFGGRGPSVELGPLQAATDLTKPLAAKLLAVPALRSRYLSSVRDIAVRWLDWRTLGPMVEKHRALISPHVLRDTRKLDSSEAFLAGAEDLKDFAVRRQAFLLQAASAD